MEIEDEQKENLLKQMRNIRKNLEEKLVIVSGVKKEILKMTEQCVNDLKERQAEIYRLFEEMIHVAEQQSSETNEEIDQEISALRENICMVASLEQNIESKDEAKFEELMSHQETADAISTINEDDLSGPRTFEHPEYVTNRFLMDSAIGYIGQVEISIDLPEPTKDSNDLQEEGGATGESNSYRINYGSQIDCSGTDELFINFRFFSS